MRLEAVERKLNSVSEDVTIIDKKLSGISEGVTNIDKRLTSFEVDVQDLGAEIQDTQGLLFEVAGFLPNSLDSNYKPMRKWMKKVEHSRAAGDEGCRQILKH